MALRRAKTIVVAWLCLTLAQPLRSQPSPVEGTQPASTQPKRPTAGFVDYTLGRINPADKDYGACIDDSRRLLLTETIEDGYFWSNALTLGLLLVFFLVILFQRGLLRRRALMYADALGQYQSTLARAEAQTDDAARRNREFMEALRLATAPAARKSSHEQISSTVGAASVPPSPTDAPEERRKGKVTAATAAGPSAPGGTHENAAVSVAGDRQRRVNAADNTAEVAPGLDLIAQNNALQQQLGLTQDQVKQLRRQLNESERQLQAEKQKNRTLKGE